MKRSTINSTTVTPINIDTLKSGEIKDLERLYRQFARHLYNYGRKFSADSQLIEDCIQELFLTIWTRRSHLNNPADIKNYLFKSFRHLVFKKIKLLEGRVNYEDIENYPFEVSLSIEEKIIAHEKNSYLQDKIKKTLDDLTPRQREAIFLKFYEGLSYEEIAQVMDIGVKGSYKLVARSIEALRTKLSPDQFLIAIFLLGFKISN